MVGTHTPAVRTKPQVLVSAEDRGVCSLQFQEALCSTGIQMVPGRAGSGGPGE